MAQTPKITVDDFRAQFGQGGYGLTNLDRFITGNPGKEKIDIAGAQRAVISDVYKLNPAQFMTGSKGAIDMTAARAAFDRAQPKLTFTPTNDFVGSIAAFQSALNQMTDIGIENINEADRLTLKKYADQVNDYKPSSVSGTAQDILDGLNDTMDAIKNVHDQIKQVDLFQARASGYKADGTKNKNVNVKDETNLLFEEQTKLRRLIDNGKDSLQNFSFTLGNLQAADFIPGSGQTDTRVGRVDAGLSGLAAKNLFGQSSLSGRLNPQVTDDQIRSDLASIRKTKADEVYQLGNAALVDLNQQLSQANAFKATLSQGDPRLASTQTLIDRLTKDISDVTSDVTEARAIYDNPGNFDDQTIADFRETLVLPEERAINEINLVDPNYLATSRSLSNQFASMAQTPIGPTQDDRTEALRGMIEDEALNQLALGSTLDESTKREVQQAVRGAQAARGNVFGVAPATEEAMQSGLMAEQRRNQRYGAAAAFLGSGMTRGDQAARNTSLRQSLDMTRLGAANEFLTGGANPYNIASQRVSNQNANALNYINAQTAAAGGFANQANQVNPYMFINPNAGFLGAQNAAGIYGDLLRFTSDNYRSQAGSLAQVAQANSVPNYISSFSGLVPNLSF